MPDRPSSNRVGPAEPVRLAFFLAPQFPMIAFASAIEPLRQANRLSGRTLYEWRLISIDGEPVAASNGIRIFVDDALDRLTSSDMLVVCVGLEPLQFAANRPLHHRLRRLARHGCTVGAISAGSFVLADAGLLSGRRCTVHWEYTAMFSARYPRLALSQDLYVVDGDVFTCSGGTAALDLMLHFVREHWGPGLAMAVAEQFLHARIREHGEHQRMDLAIRYGLFQPKLVEVIRRMENALEEPLDLHSIAAEIGLSVRQIERLFQQHIGIAPSVFHLQLRLRRGRDFLTRTSQSIQDIATLCGFGSTSNFCHAYKRNFDRTPREDRLQSRRAKDETNVGGGVSAAGTGAVKIGKSH
jgi:AraC family transcriptional regulator, glycine betaine-responsive activator